MRWFSISLFHHKFVLLAAYLFYHASSFSKFPKRLNSYTIFHEFVVHQNCNVDSKEFELYNQSSVGTENDKIGKNLKTFLIIIPFVFMNIDSTSYNNFVRFPSSITYGSESALRSENDFNVESYNQQNLQKQSHSELKIVYLNELFHTITSTTMAPFLSAPAASTETLPSLSFTSDQNEAPNIRSALVNIFDALKDAYIVDNMNTFISVSVAETLSGIVAGLSSRKFADLLNDRKRDTLFTKLFSTGFFFGGRSFFRTLATFIGVYLFIS
jgi:hypothetical protein